MTGIQDPSLDETVWAAPEIVREMGGIHTNTILPYFSQSHFFDATSNNATLTTQALYNQNLYPILQTREAFEGRLRTMQGLEFMVTHDPSENDTKHDHNGVWVIRKQLRKKRQAAQDEIVGISSYFVVGENVYMAPSIGNILSSRLLSTVNSLRNVLSTVSALPTFTPALGHTYFPQNTQPRTNASSSFQPATSEDSASPAQINAVPANDGELSSSGETTVNDTPQNPQSLPSNDIQSSALFAQSFDLYLRYGAEYMDENPLVGEPGSFKLSKARSGESALPIPSSNNSKTSRQPSPLKSDVPAGGTKKSPGLEVKTDVPPEMGSGRKGSGSAKSPTTPGAGKKKKERRKSKALGTEEEEAGTPRGDG